MPEKTQTGPRGQGPATGRGMGFCGNRNSGAGMGRGVAAAAAVWAVAASRPGPWWSDGTRSSRGRRRFRGHTGA